MSVRDHMHTPKGSSVQRLIFLFPDADFIKRLLQTTGSPLVDTGIVRMFAWLILLFVALMSANAEAVPSYARQTGQNCIACHAGGQFPELTPYGRMFKLTGYTIGERKLPLSVMGVLTANKVRVNDPAAGHTQDGTLTFNTGSLFLAGKILDKAGVFAQITYDNYASPSDRIGFSGHTAADNMDFRYADRLIADKTDLVYGFTLHNNPGVQDVWNSMPAWGYGVVPGSTGAGAATVPLLDGGLGQQVAGAGAYVYWDQTVYAELTGYRTGDGVFSFMTQGNGVQTVIKGTNPYLRLGLSHEWGAHNAMIGVTHLDVNQYPDPADLTTATDHYRDNSLDLQYQYLLYPHSLTATLTRIHESIDYGAAGSLADTVDSFRAKASYVFRDKYGATLSYFDVKNSLNTFTSPTGESGTRGWTPEMFWAPVQYMRLGVQYTWFNKVNGVSGNTDGAGRKAGDDNTLLFYVWGAY